MAKLKLMIKRAFFSLLIAFPLTCSVVFGQITTDSVKQQIRLDQIGFYPNAPKIAIVLGDRHDIFIIKTTAGKQVYKGKLKRSDKPALNGSYTSIADFSAFSKSGKYMLEVPCI